MTHSPELAEALRHEGALRRLACMLHLGGADADDAVQHALTQVALGKRPAGMPLWAFLRATLRHHAFNLKKLAWRRRRRESAFANGELVLPVDEMVARDQLRRRVAEAVIALPEPYRTTVWLRWFEGCDVDAVAAHMAAPPNTVRTRLQRAHALLKARLDRDYGDGRWAMLALPIAAAGGAVALPVGVFAAAGALLAASLAIGLSLMAALRGAEIEPRVARVVADVPLPAANAVRPAVASLLPSPRPRAAPPPTAASEPRLRVLCADGRPLADASVWWWRADDRPAWTLGGYEPGRRRAPAAEDASDEPALPTTSVRTDARGEVEPPSPAPVAMAVEAAPNLWFATEVPRDGTLRLPPTCSVRVAVRDLPASARWEARVECTWHGAMGTACSKHVCLHVTGGVWRLHGTWSGETGSKQVALTVPDGTWRWAAKALGHGFLLEPLTPEPARAPAEFAFRAVRTIPRVVAVVHERDGSPTARRGVVRLRSESGSITVRELAAGRAVFDETDTFGARPTLRVRMENGDEAVASVRVATTDAVCRLFLRGELPAARMRLDGLRRGDVHRVFLENAHYEWTRIDDVDARGHDADVEFGVVDDGLWIAGVVPAAGQRACVVTRAGRVALGSFAWDCRAQLQWLASRVPVTVAVGALYRDCGEPGTARVHLELGLPTANAGITWMVLWAHERHEPGELSLRAPIWGGLELPTELPSRVRVFAGPGAASRVLLERTLR